jgi:gamma-glutamyltranspeptidase / glutathione hydrolase
MRSGKLRIGSVYLTAFAALLLLQTADLPAANTIPERPVEGSRGMVASAHPLASRVGLEILKKGGNAVDAAIATAFALGVVEPNASGVGGGGFIVFYRAKTRKVEVIDYREVAPLKATAEMYLGPDGKVIKKDSIIGHRAVAVPGMLAGLDMALKRWGTMTLKQVMAPSIKIAEEGYTVSETLNGMMKDHLDVLSQFPAAGEIYLKDGLPYEVGDRLILKDLAKAYRLIAEKGPKVFYRGEIGDALVREMQAGKGLITKEDLARYRPKMRQPVRGTYRGFEIISMPSPSSGGTHIIEMLNILEGFDMRRLGHNTPASIHILAETMKQVFADCFRYSGDTDFVKVPTRGLISKEYAAEVRKLISEERVNQNVPPGNPDAYQSGSTSHSSYVDKDGNMVALTQTINQFFGSGVIIPGYGIMLNDEMDDFEKLPGNVNSIQPRKKPLSSMSPSLVLKDGKPFISLGTPGALRILTVLPQILINIIDHGMDIQQAINAPRIHCQSAVIAMESRIPAEVRAALQAKGHKVGIKEEMDLYFGGAQAVFVDTKSGRLYGGADPRRDGFAAGY